MKVVILAGGLGTRLSEETEVKPKPMVEIGGYPILWHIMKIYSHYGYNDFIILLGYKGYVIKEYFANYFLHQSNVVFDFSSNSRTILNSTSEPWRVTLYDTGAETMTGGRLLRVRELVGAERFMLTYGDGVADVNIPELVRAHEKSGGAAAMTTVQPRGRFGSVAIEDTGRISSFIEKPKGDGLWINGGFFVFEPEIFDFIAGDSTHLEQEPLETLAKNGKLFSYRHTGFWQPMDTLRDKLYLNSLWESGKAPWKFW